MYSRLFLLCAGLNFWACVSSSRYHSVRSDRDQLAIQLKENQITKDSFEVIAQDLETTKLQLQKTENVLIEFYLKYNQGSEKSDSVSKTNQLANEQQESTIQESQMLEMKRLNDQLVQARTNYEQLNEKYEKLLKSKEPKRSTAKKLDSLNKEIVALKNAVAKEKANQVIQDKKLAASNSMMDSMTSQIQYGEIRIKQLQYELNEVKQESEALNSSKGFDQKLQESELRTEINQLKAGLDELNRLNAQMLESVQLKDKEIQKSQEALAALKTENEQTRQELKNLKVKESASVNEATLKSVQEELNQQLNTIKVLNEIIEDKNQQIQKQKTDRAALESKLNKAEAQIHAASNKSINLEQSDSIRKIQEMDLITLKRMNQDLIDKMEILAQEKEQLQNQLKQLKLELKPLDRMKDSIQMQQAELLRLKKMHSEELNIANSRLKNKQSSLDSLNVKIKTLQESNKQLQQHVAQQTTTSSQTEAAPQVEAKQEKKEIHFNEVEKQPSQKSTTDGSKKRLSEPVIAQLKALAKNHTKLEFETTASKEQGFMQIPWADLFDSGSYAIKESGANLMALFSSTVKQNRKLRVSFVKGTQSPTDFVSAEKRIHTLKKLMQVYGVSQNQFNESSEIPVSSKWTTNTDQVVLIVYTE